MHPVAMADDERSSSPPPPPSRTYFLPIKSVEGGVGGEHLQRLYLYFTLYGGLMSLLGLIAILLPIIFHNLAIPQMVAWMLIVGGLLAFLHFLLLLGAPSTTSFLGFGILHMALGLWFLIQTTVTEGNAFVWIMTGWFVLHGVVKLIMAFQLRALTSWPAVLVDAIISVALGIINLALAAAYGFQPIGILFGIDLAATAISFFFISFMAYLGSRASTNAEPLLQHHGPHYPSAASSA